MLPKRGKTLPEPYAKAIANALSAQLGQSHQAVKVIHRWTGASERTIKNWLAGSCGPSGPHLVALVHHSNPVLETFLRMAERPDMAAAGSLLELRNEFARTLERIDGLLQVPATRKAR
jgi:hypothetical protein